MAWEQGGTPHVFASQRGENEINTTFNLLAWARVDPFEVTLRAPC